MKLETVPCGLCGADESRPCMSVPSLRLPADGENFCLRECTSCGLVRLNPRPSADCYPRLYKADLYRAPRQRLVSFLEGLILGERVSYLSSRFNGGRLLDVGCGNGKFIQAVLDGNGFDACGLEPFQEQPENVPAEIRSRISCEPIQQAKYANESFDLVTLWHVLEHLDEPVAALRKLREMLAPGGRLIIEVPNLASHEARWLGPYWYNLDAPYHLWHFNPETLSRMLSGAGMEVVELTASAITRPVWLLNYMILAGQCVARKSFPGLARRFPNLSLGAGLLLSAVHRLVFASSCPMMRVVCTRKPD